MKSETGKNTALFLAIDQGGHASRALIFDAQGKVLSKHFCDIATETPQPGWVEHDAEALVASVQMAMEGAVATLGSQKKDLVAAGLATQRSSIVCWDRNTRRALSKVISWRDVRGADAMKAFEAQAESIHHKTGLYPSPHYGASKLRWCLDHLPDVKAAMKKGELCFGPLASFLSARMTEEGQVFADPSNAGRTLLWNIALQDWDPHLLESFQIPIALPQCVPTRNAFGHISFAGQKIPLKIVTGDQAAALFHNGMPQADGVYINLGTGAFLQRVMPKSHLNTGRLLSSVVLSQADKTVYALEGTVNGAGAALAWFAEIEETEAWPKAAGQWIEAEKNPPLFINGVGGLGSPFWVPKMESRFVGNGGLPARYVAVIESILFLIRANLDEMNQVIDAPKKLIVSGGLSTLDALCQRLADLTNLTVVRSPESEATARGLAFLLGASVSGEAGQSFLPVGDTGLARRYEHWLQEMKMAIRAL